MDDEMVSLCLARFRIVMEGCQRTGRAIQLQVKLETVDACLLTTVLSRCT